MAKQPEILYIPDVAALLGKTESAITSAYRRGQIPGAFKLLGRVAWRCSSIDEWIESLSNPNQKYGQRCSKGRPRQLTDSVVLRIEGFNARCSFENPFPARCLTAHQWCFHNGRFSSRSHADLIWNGCCYLLYWFQSKG
jgi:predicted DNA-binding transcriptional regulator AlpA